jgi:Zn ribbon nucleic-acid-binding protein
MCGGEYITTFGEFKFNNRRRCKKCSSEIRATKSRMSSDEFKNRVKLLVGNEYSFLEEYTTRKDKIKCIHNDCGYEYYVRPMNFLKGSRCPRCSNVTNHKYTNRKESNRKSTEEFKQEVYNQVGSEYEVIGDYVNSKTKIAIRHTLCGYIYETAPPNFLSGSRCPKCDKYHHGMNHDMFTRLVYESSGTEYQFLERYAGKDVPLKVRHEQCGHEYTITPASFFRGVRCPKCFKYKIRRTTEDFRKEVNEMTNGEYVFIGDFVNVDTKANFKHIECGKEFMMRPDGFLRGRRCPHCNQSKGEKRIQNFLVDNTIHYVTQYSFNKLLGLGGKQLKFDFAIFDSAKSLYCLIEFDGQFHFKKQYDGDRHEIIKNHDRRKNTYCQQHNIPLIRIPYWEFDNIEKILTEKLNGVINVNNIREVSN